MFLQLVTPKTAGPPSTLDAIDSLFLYTPLQISALVETVWRNRYNAENAIFTPWPQWITDAILAPKTAAGFPNFISGTYSPR